MQLDEDVFQVFIIAGEKLNNRLTISLVPGSSPFFNYEQANQYLQIEDK